MIYVMGAVRGHKDKFDELLKRLNLNENEDSLFVLGDIVSFGNDGIGTLMEMRLLPNVYPVMGKGEMFLSEFFSKIIDMDFSDDINELLRLHNDEELCKMYDYITRLASAKPIADFLKLRKDQREDLLDYLTEFSMFEEVEANGKCFVLTNGGLNGKKVNLPPKNQEDFKLLTQDFSVPAFKNKILVVGGIPVSNIHGASRTKPFLKAHNLVCDLGLEFGGEKLCAVCLDNLKVFLQ